MGVTNSDIAVSKEEPGADIGDEEDEINVDKEVDEEMPLERDRHNDDDNVSWIDLLLKQSFGDVEYNIGIVIFEYGKISMGFDNTQS